MSVRIRWETLALGALVLVAPHIALAQTQEDGLTTVHPTVQNETRTPEATPQEQPRPAAAQGGTTHVFDAYRVHADSVFAQRMVGGAGALVVGGTLIGLGVVTQEKWSEEFGTVIIVFGAISTAGGLLAFVFPTEIENVASSNGVYVTTNPSAEQEALLEKEWQRLASKARTGRQVGAGIAFVLSAAAVVGGIYALSADSIDDETKSWLAPTLLVSGGATAAAGVQTLLIESPTETSYAAFMATRGKGPSSSSSWAPSVRVSASPLRNGGFVGLAANF